MAIQAKLQRYRSIILRPCFVVELLSLPELPVLVQISHEEGMKVRAAAGLFSDPWPLGVGKNKWIAISLRGFTGCPGDLV